MQTTPVLFTGLLDDAAMFPPGNASPAAAIAAHRNSRHAPFADIVGPLLVAAERWEDFVAAHAEAGAPALSVSVVGQPEPPGPVPAQLELVGLEFSVTAPPIPDGDSALLAACEITGAADKVELLARIAEQRARGRRIIAKFRTGGVVGSAFPTDDHVATVLVAAAAVGAPLKFTAGLHWAVRCTDPTTGFEHQGFLNLMCATLAAREGADASAVAAQLGVRDRGAVTAEVGSWSTAEATQVRDGFVSFGCCGVEDPIRELADLKLLEPAVT